MSWPSRDPIDYQGGINLYAYVLNCCPNRIDMLGLEWTITRKGEARATATPMEGDTIAQLAAKIGLDASEFKKWLAPVGKAPLPATENEQIKTGVCFTVPNIAFIDVATYDWGGLGWRLINYRAGRQAAWSNEGLQVVYSTPALKSEILSHLQDSNIYRFLFIGHGAAGCLAANADGGDVDEGVICPGKYTPFRINRMELIACETNSEFGNWKTNVAQGGILRTVRGKCTLFNFDFVDEGGQ